MLARADATAAARAASLRWVSDEAPGIRRLRRGRGFVYRRSNGSLVGDPHTLARIRAIVIPPAWERVWICERADGHIQASGYDARGRKQYRYHADWRRVRAENKYGRLIAFGGRLPAIRRRITADLSLHHKVGLTDRRIAAVVRRCQELPGQELFVYEANDGEVRNVGSGDVNDYLRTIAGSEFSAKDFRTWAGTLLAARALTTMPRPESARGRRQAVVAAVKEVAARLGNTAAVCRRCYVHPAVLSAFEEGRTLATRSTPAAFARLRRAGLERALLRLLAASPSRPPVALRAAG